MSRDAAPGPAHRTAALERENAQLRRALDELTVLNDLAREIGAARDVEQVVNTIVRRAQRAVGAEQGVVTLVGQDPDDPTTTYVRTHAESGTHEALRPTASLIGWMHRHGRALTINAPHDDPRSKGAPWQAEVRSVLSVPLQCQGRLTGILTLYNKRAPGDVSDTEGFSPADQRIAAIIASQSAQVIENARLYEEELALAQLREIDSLKSRFFANISHEFRTPLTLILGPARDLLAERFGPLATTQRSQLTLIQRNGQRLLRLVTQLLDLAKLEAGAMKLQAARTDLGPLVAATAQSFASLAERQDVTLQVDVPTEPVWAWVEPAKVEQVLVNLLGNAFKFTEAGGDVTVTLRLDMDTIALVVMDTGAGIPAEALPHVFDRFRQADGSATRPHEGTGIGLALVREWVALHGGTVAVESEEGVGTTFTVVLPTGREHLPADALGASAVSDAGGVQGLPSYRGDLVLDLVIDEDYRGIPDESVPDDAPLILIVEDNPDVRAYLRSHLADAYRLAEAEDGQAGLEQARALLPDLVLSDVMMPKMDGIALCQALKEDPATEHVPVVLLTARADPESRLEGLGTGADDYLPKPFSADELLVRVENLIELRRRLRARFSGEVVVRPAGVTVSSEDARFIKQVRAVVEAEMRDAGFSVERLADSVSMSPRQLRRRLKATSGLSPSGFIRGMRLARAADLLSQGAGRVSEIAYAVGFTDATHFTGVFKQVYGTVPSAYRREDETRLRG